MDVSVVIPSRNRAGLLRQTLRTALSQERVDLEVIVVDDGSTDDTPAVLASMTDPRVQVLRNEVPGGVSRARNRGIEAATGTWIAPLDDDDLWRPEKLALQLEAARGTGRVWAFSGVASFSEGPVLWRLTRPPSPEQVLARVGWDSVVPSGSSNAIMRRDVLVEVGRFDEQLSAAADWDLWARLAQVGPPATVDDFLVAYRLHPGSMSLNTEVLLAANEEVGRRYAHLRDGRPLDHTATFRWFGSMHMRAGQRKEARRAYIKAFRLGHRPALRKVLRTLVPGAVPPPSLTWPAGLREWLEEVLAQDAH